MKIIITVLLSITAIAAPSKKPDVATLMAAAQSSDWRALDPENTLYLELAQGRVIIEMSPEFAPQHVANVKALAREKYWDGLAIVRVQDNYVVQWADPNTEKPDKKRAIKNAKANLPAEFDVALDPKLQFTALTDKDAYASETGFYNGFAAGRDKKTKKQWLLHCYGYVGAGRDNSPDSGGGAELYAVIGHAPRHLDRNVTLFGRVIQGIDLLSSLPRGKGKMGFYEKPEQNIPIRSIRVAADVPEKERTQLEILRTDTKLFKDLLEARRNRQEEWFHFRVGRIEACNVPVAVREKK